MVFLRDPLSASGSPHSFGDVSPLVASVLPKRKGIFGPLVNGEDGHTNKGEKRCGKEPGVGNENNDRHPNMDV